MKTKLLLLLLLANFSIYAQTNLVPNSGLETWTSGIVQNWTALNTVAQSSDYASGLYSAKLSYTNAGLSPKITAKVPLKGGVTYTVKFKYKYVQSNYSGTTPIALNISGAGSSSTISNSTFAKNNLWTERETTFTPDIDLSYDLSISTFSFGGDIFDVLIDDVRVYVQGTEQYTLIPDVNFEKRLIELGIDSGVPDGKVLTLDAKSVTTLKINPLDISSLTGIQDFESLETLNCFGTSVSNSGGNGKLTTLDLSKNLKLKTLDCSSNQLTSLDLSKNIDLTSLNISVNKITGIDLSKNLKLNSLVFNYNLTTAIDVSKNLDLKYLEFTSTLISAIDLSQNTALLRLRCSNNSNLKSIDVSKNIALESLDVSGLGLTALDVTKNISLNDLRCYSNQIAALDVSKIVNLISFHCNSNKLTSLDVSKNLNLSTLSCFTNELTTIDVSKNIKLTDLILNVNLLTTLDVSKNINLRNFGCAQNQLTSLNLKNGANTLLKTNNINLTSNPKLSCIVVDDVAYANTNWGSMKDRDTYFSTYDCALTSPISDPAFEDKLIALGIDKDGKNGLVLNASISSVTSLDVSNSSIVNLNGIQAFTALKTLNASGNLLNKVNLSKNTNLTTLNTSNNPTLTCIQVADLAVAASWTTTKDAIASFNLDCNIYTLIPDGKFEDKLIALGIDKDGKNGKVPTEEISQLTSLDVSNSGIEDLTGIQDFVSLKTLYCNSTTNAKLTKLDVTKNTQLTTLDLISSALTSLDVSKNVLLKRLNLNFNKVSSLDVSKNIALTELYVTANPLLQAVDVTKNTELLYLRLESNGLKTIDVTQNTKLINLAINNNQLKSIDVSKNIALTGLTASGNSLTTIDVTKNTALTDLLVDQNQLTSIDVSKNLVLNTLTIYYNQITSLDVSKNTALTYISSYHNKISSIDVSKNLNLTSLDVSENSLLKLDVSKNVLLQSLYCSDNSLVNLNLKNGKNNLLPSNKVDFRNNPTLNCIQVDDIAYANANWSGKKDAVSYFSPIDCSLATILPDSKFEDKLIALGIDTDGKNGVILNSSAAAVTSLDVSNLTITDLSGIQSFTALKTLNVSGNLLQKLDLSKNTALNTLNSSNNPALPCIQVADVTAAANWTVTKDAITTFNIDCNVYTLIPDPKFEDYLIAANIDKDGKNGKVKTESIDKITVLNVSNKGIEDLTGIQDFTALKELNAYSNEITAIDVSKNIALTSVDFRYNTLSTIDLTKNINLTNINIAGNKVKTIDVSKNTKLAFFYANGNKLIALDVTNNPELAQFWCENNEIRRLDLSKNKKLTQALVSYNKLVNVNIKNGANTLLINSSNNNGGVRFYGNPDLKCIQVDDENYSNTNWTTQKDATAAYSSAACPVVVPYTLIPDPNFEDKLIALGIDKDGKNGKVETMSIVTLTSLKVSNSNIKDLTGIEGFTALTSLECDNNQLKTINVSKNIELTSLNASKNQLTALDVSRNAQLSTLNVSNNAIAVLDVSYNTSLNNLNCSTNGIAVLDLSKNTKLTILSASFNAIQNLDISKNTILKEIDCAGNNMYNLNLKNGNNVNMQRVIFGNFTQNPNLLCIQVDDAAFSTANWIAKDATASYSSDACPINVRYTLIPDTNFEKILISKGIDKDGVNGKVLTASISNIAQLYVYDTVDKITDLTGIEDFSSLQNLDCSNNKLTTLNLSKNTKLTSLNFSNNTVATVDISAAAGLTSLYGYNNLLTAIDVSKNTALKTFSVYSNKLTTIDLTKNTALTSVELSSNQLTNIDIIKNINLTSITLSRNQLTSLDVSKNTIIGTLLIDNNQLSTLDVSANVLLTYLNASTNKLENLNISNNTALTTLVLTSNLIKALDVSKNTALKSFDVSKNKLTTLDVSKNIALQALAVNNNELTSLNLQNGKNEILTYYNLYLSSNPKLYCILVDDVMYANANWSGRKDSFAVYNIECTGEIVVPSNNFVIETKGESCLGENNGELSITAKQTFAYSASINGKTTAFTNNALKVTALTPGVYAITITIPGQIFEQNFNVTIAKGATITGKSSITSRKVEVEITEGTAPFTVFVDGQAQFETTDSNFSLDLDKAVLLEVATAKACEGVYSKKITTMDVLGTLAAYPNPTTGSFEIEIPESKNEVKIEIYNFGGQLVSNKNYTIENGKAQLNLENNPSGIYAAKIYLDTPEYIKIIKK